MTSSEISIGQRLAHRWGVSLEAARLHGDALVWDMILPLMAEVGNDFDILDRFAAAGVDFTSLTIAGDEVGIAGAIQRLASARRFLARQEAWRLVTSVAEIRSAKADGKLAVGLHLEGTRCLERDLNMVQLFYDLGVRHSILAFNANNSVAGGCAELEDAGLSRFGHRVVEEMNRVGMLIDLSHTGRKSTFQILEASRDPVIISHSNADHVYGHYRNVTDEQITLCAASGGVVGISGSTAYLGQDAPTAEALFQHIDHVANLVGVHHVGLGTDFVGDPVALHAYLQSRPDDWPKGRNPELKPREFFPPERLPKLTERLLKSGYAESDIACVLGGNFLRVCEAVWK